MRVTADRNSFIGIRSNETYGPPSDLRFTVRSYIQAYGSAAYVGWLEPYLASKDDSQVAPQNYTTDGVISRFQREGKGLIGMTLANNSGPPDKSVARSGRNTKDELGWTDSRTHELEIAWRRDRVSITLNDTEVAQLTEHVPEKSMPMHVVAHNWAGPDCVELTIDELQLEAP